MRSQQGTALPEMLLDRRRQHVTRGRTPQNSVRVGEIDTPKVSVPTRIRAVRELFHVAPDLPAQLRVRALTLDFLQGLLEWLPGGQPLGPLAQKRRIPHVSEDAGRSLTRYNIRTGRKGKDDGKVTTRTGRPAG